MTAPHRFEDFLDPDEMALLTDADLAAIDREEQAEAEADDEADGL